VKKAIVPEVVVKYIVYHCKSVLLSGVTNLRAAGRPRPRMVTSKR
jgi:hypothetical protein